jgi:hypothetical protein
MQPDFGPFQGYYAAWWSYVQLTLRTKMRAFNWAEHYDVLRGYYLNNGLYEALDEALSGGRGVDATLKPLRNPAFRIVEFYAAKMWPGALPAALPIVADNAAIIPAIKQVWQWSNWGAEKETAARWFAMYGDMFIKVSTRTDDSGRVTRVFLQNLPPQHVTWFTADERGYLTSVRLDVPRLRDVGNGEQEPYIYTEVWTKTDMRAWEHKWTAATPVERLGQPVRSVPLSEFGIDFIPIVRQQLRPSGGDRGNGAFIQSLDKIDEANRLATRLHQLLFRYNKPTWAMAGVGNDNSGRPLPPPRLGTATATTDTVDFGDDTILSIGGNGTLTSLVPQLDYAAAIDALQKQMDELGADNPELAYYALRNHTGDVSGRALERMLGDAVDRLLSARALAEDALQRAHAMALTIGQAVGLFRGLGRYEAGDFVHGFAERAVFPASELEDAQAAMAWVQAGLPLATALRRVGWSDEEISVAVEDAGLIPGDAAEAKLRSERYLIDKSMGVASAETLAGRLGYEWAQEQQRIATETVNTGDVLLAQFDQGANA